MEYREYKFNNSVLRIIFGDIMTSKAEVIVSSDDTWITMGGGISGCIRQQGGECIRTDAQKMLPAKLGDVIVSTAGELEYQKYIFHSLTIDYRHKDEIYKGFLTAPEDIQNYILQHSIDKCFRLMHTLELTSIAFPCLGGGVAHIPLSKIAEVMSDAISAHLCKTQKSYNVELYLYDRYGNLSPADYIDFFEKFAVKSALHQNSRSNQPIPQKSSSATREYSEEQITQISDMPHRIFISYARNDSGTVADITRLLDSCSLSYWIDKEGIYSGENYKEVIVDALDTAQVVLFISSEHSNESVNVIREIGYAVKQNKIIIPILLDEYPYAKSIRLDIADIDQIIWDGSKATDSRLIASLAYALR